MAVFLRTEDELLSVLASFYALGVARGGWLAHRSLPGGADRERELLTQAGCDVARLEADGRPVVTLCPYIVGDLDGAAAIATLDDVAASHTGVLLPRAGGGYGLLRPA